MQDTAAPQLIKNKLIFIFPRKLLNNEKMLFLMLLSICFFLQMILIVSQRNGTSVILSTQTIAFLVLMDLERVPKGHQPTLGEITGKFLLFAFKTLHLNR